MKARFVIPWYGPNIPGGAELACRKTAENLHRKGLDVEVLTTCAKDCYNWANYHSQGLYNENGITVRRFKADKRNEQSFDQINLRLINNQKITADQEKVFIKEMINSQGLYSFINEHSDGYYFFMPYMFGTTYYGSKIHPHLSYLIPCLHDESYAYLNIYKDMFQGVRGIISLSKPEEQLTQKLYGVEQNRTHILGVGVDNFFTPNPFQFKKKFKINDSFILYVGRKEVGKNVKLLIDYFITYKKMFNNNLKLVLIGGGSIKIPREAKSNVIEMGFISEQDKLDAFSAAVVHCQPSDNESFSFTIMESWLCNRPVLVSKKCPVTLNHCQESNGGLYFYDLYSFIECINYFLQNENDGQLMARNGYQYVQENYSWNAITKKYLALLKQDDN